MIIHSLFSILNFLSKIYYLLHDDAEIWSQEEIERIKNGIKNCQGAKGAMPPFANSPKISECECFIRFALDLEFPLFPGGKELSQTEQRILYNKIWKSYRNKLAHMAMPDCPVIAIDFGERKYEGIDGVSELLEGNTKPAFIKQGEQYAVYPDLFTRDIKKWIGWLKLLIQEPGRFSDNRINATIDWIENTN